MTGKQRTSKPLRVAITDPLLRTMSRQLQIIFEMGPFRHLARGRSTPIAQ